MTTTPRRPIAAVEYARRARIAGPGSILAYALQNRSESARDVLALAASEGKHDAAALLARMAAERDPTRPEAPEFVGDLDPKQLLCLARLYANQDFHPGDADDAISVYEAVLGHRGAQALNRDDRAVFLELLAARRMRSQVEAYLELLKIDQIDAAQPSLLRANVTNPFISGTEDSSDEIVGSWLGEINEVYRDAHLEPIDVAPGSEPPIDRLMCAPWGLVDGPLVTVIMPTYDPGPTIATALESLLAQSYRNLQILVMDDGSPAASAAALDWWEDRDPRITVVHLPVNGGTYRARNIALAQHANGDYVTVHDDDDWSHPRKIELQARHLEQHPDEAANVSFFSRATPDLQFVRINNNAVFTQRNYSSLMIRRSVLHTLGYWDVVNRGADAEMHDRIIACTGRRIPSVGRVPVSFGRAQVHGTSLTAGEINKGYLDPRRIWYLRMYRAWHRARADLGESPYMDHDEATRPFPVPASLIGSKRGRPPVGVDIVYATDFRFPGADSSLSVRELTILLGEGYRIALLQLDSPLSTSKEDLHPEVVELIRQGGLHMVSVDDAVTARLTVVRNPTVLQFVRPARSGIASGRLVLIVDHAPIESDGMSAVYDVPEVVDNARAVFAKEPTVAPASGVIRGQLDGLVDERLLSNDDWNTTTSTGDGDVRNPDPARDLVVGRHSDDHPVTLTAHDDLAIVLPRDGPRALLRRIESYLEGPAEPSLVPRRKT